MNAKTLLRLAKISKSRKTFIWGAGPTGNKVLQQARNENISVAAFIDRNSALIGTEVNGIMVQQPEILADSDPKNRPFIIIGSQAVREIALQLERWEYVYEADYIL